MIDRLFSTDHLHNVIQRRVRNACNEASRLPPAELENPDEAIRRIVQQHTIEVPRLHPDQRKAGKKREEVRRGRDYGREFEVTVVMRDVEIPFTGDRDLFNIAPSSSVVIYKQVEIGPKALVLPVLFSDRQPEDIDREVNTFIEEVETNLSRLRQEAQSLPEQLTRAVRQAIESAKQTRAAEAAVTKGLSFPVED